MPLASLMLLLAGSALSAHAQSISAEELVLTFREVCLGAAPSTARLEAFARSLGSSGDLRREQQEIGGGSIADGLRVRKQTISASSLVLPSDPMTQTTISIGLIWTEPDEQRAGELCSVAYEGPPHETLEREFRSALALGEPISPSNTQQLQWHLPSVRESAMGDVIGIYRALDRSRPSLVSLVRTREVAANKP